MMYIIEIPYSKVTPIVGWRCANETDFCAVASRRAGRELTLADAIKWVESSISALLIFDSRESAEKALYDPAIWRNLHGAFHAKAQLRHILGISRDDFQQRIANDRHQSKTA